MAKEIFNKKKHDSSAIPNKQIEQMFLSIASDDQMHEYNKLVDNGHIAIASAYASQRVFKTFNYWRDSFIKTGGDLEYLQFILWKRGK